VKLSQPKSARVINTARVLCALRKDGSLSKSDLAKKLELNKVSTGEIVEELLSNGLLNEVGKVEVENGRRPTTVEIAKDSRYVLCIDIGSRITTVALCNLVGDIVKFERIPTSVDGTVEQFCVSILKSCARTMKLVDESKIMGAGVTVCGEVSEDQQTIVSCGYLPWKDIAIADVIFNNLNVCTIVFSASEALVCAEKIYSEQSLVSNKPIMYIDWGSHISLALIVDGKVVVNNTEFGHTKVFDTGICVCGNIGCLETVCATWAISTLPEARLKNLWDKLPENCLVGMAKALKFAKQISCADRVIVSGDGATIPDDKLEVLQSLCEGITVERSALGDKANIIACAECTLDAYLYQRTMLDEMRSWM